MIPPPNYSSRLPPRSPFAPFAIASMAPTAEEEEAAGIGGGRGAAAVEALLGLVADVSALPDNRGPFRRMCCDLARRVKLLAPLFDELGDDADSLGPAEIRGLETLCASLLEAKDVLRFVNEGSKLYQVTAID